MKRYSYCLAAFLAVLLAQNVQADSWKILGPRPMGMGGAFVAIAEGPIAQYWNPAGLAQEKQKFGFQLPISAKVEFTGVILKDANTLGDLANKFTKIQNAQTSGTDGAMDADAMGAFYESVAAIKDMDQPGKGITAEIATGGLFKLGKIALSVNNFTSIGADPNIDTVNIGLGLSGQPTRRRLHVSRSLRSRRAAWDSRHHHQ